MKSDNYNLLQNLRSFIENSMKMGKADCNPRYLIFDFWKKIIN